MQYIEAGISTDHECFTFKEGEHKLKHGMKVLIREGSAAKNFEALVDLIPEHYEHMMFCSDDKHPDSLVDGHINALVKRSLAKGIDLFKVLQVACVNPVEHYNLEIGQLRIGDDADFIIIDNPQSFNIKQTYIKGECVATNGTSHLPIIKAKHPNNFKAKPKSTDQFKQATTGDVIPVIEAIDGELITNRLDLAPKVVNGYNESDVSRDILKITVVNRYEENARPSIGFIKNFGLQQGAIASSVGHDSHNIIAIGVDDEAMTTVVNACLLYTSPSPRDRG